MQNIPLKTPAKPLPRRTNGQELAAESSLLPVLNHQPGPTLSWFMSAKKTLFFLYSSSFSGSCQYSACTKLEKRETERSERKPGGFGAFPVLQPGEDTHCSWTACV